MMMTVQHATTPAPPLALLLRSARLTTEHLMDDPLRTRAVSNTSLHLHAAYTQQHVQRNVGFPSSMRSRASIHSCFGNANDRRITYTGRVAPCPLHIRTRHCVYACSLGIYHQSSCHTNPTQAYNLVSSMAFRCRTHGSMATGEYCASNDIPQSRKDSYEHYTILVPVRVYLGGHRTMDK